jgi:uncharacterized membrane protein
MTLSAAWAKRGLTVGLVGLGLLVAAGVGVWLGQKYSAPPEFLKVVWETAEPGLGLQPLTPSPKAPYLPEEIVTFAFRVRNESPHPKEYRIVWRSPEGWKPLSANNRAMELPPGGTRTLFANWLIPPQTPAGVYPLSVEFYGPSAAEPKGELALRVQVGRAALPRLRAAEVRLQAPARAKVSLTLELENRGNVRGRFRLGGEPPPGWRVEFSPRALNLEPGERRLVELFITIPPQAPWGATKFSVWAQAPNPRAKGSLTVIVDVLPRS